MHEPTSGQRKTAQENQRQVVRFLIVGGLSVVVDFACYTLFVGSFFLGTSLAKGASYLLGMAVGFVGNKYWTFGSARRTVSEPLSYVMLYAFTLAVNIGVNAAVLSATGGWKLPAFLVATGVTTILNFLGMRLVTFRHGIQDRLRAQRAGESIALQTISGPHVSADLASSGNPVHG